MEKGGVVMAKALRPFEGAEGYKDETSEPFEVPKGRFAELKANGLVEEAKGVVPPSGDEARAAAEAEKAKKREEAERAEREEAEKAKRTPDNKMAQSPKNKTLFGKEG